MNPRIFLISCLLVAVTTTSAQRSTDKSVKFTSWSYPKVAANQPMSYQVVIHNGSIPLESTMMIKKKGLVASLQKTQDDINNRTVEYTTYYPFDIATSNPDLLIEIAFGIYTPGANTLKEHNIPCYIKGEKLTKETIRECPAFYYEFTYSLPYVIRLTDKSGNILHSAAFMGEGQNTFGYDATSVNGFLSKSELVAAYATQLKNQPQFQASQAIVEQLNQAEATIQSLCFYAPLVNKLSIASAAGKGFDYSALDAAQKQTVDALNNYDKTTPAAMLTKLAPSIKTWNQELGTLDMKDNSRINRSIATGLYNNLALVYAYGWQLDSARIYASKAQQLIKYAASGNAKESVEAVAADIREREAIFKAYQAQATTINVRMKAPELLDAIRVKSKKASYAVISGKSKYTDWAASITKSDDLVVKTTVENLIDKSVSGSSPANSYEERVQKTSFQGYMLLLTAFGDGKMEKLPEDICSITYLNELTITNNSLKSLPESISQLTELKKLNVSNNQLTSLPKGLQQCKKLKSLNLKGNLIPEAEVKALQAALPECKIKV